MRKGRARGLRGRGDGDGRPGFARGGCPRRRPRRAASRLRARRRSDSPRALCLVPRAEGAGERPAPGQPRRAARGRDVGLPWSWPDAARDSLLVQHLDGRASPRMPHKKAPLVRRSDRAARGLDRRGDAGRGDPGVRGGGAPRGPLGLREARCAPRLPPVRATAWVRSPDRRFVLARLEKEGLAPSPEAVARDAPPPGHASTSSACRRRPRRSTPSSPTPARRVRAGRRPAAGLAALRRALGAALARPGPLRRHQRLREGPPPHDLEVPRLGDRRAQPRHAVRPVHHRADRRRHAAGRDARAADRDRLPPQHAAQRGGRHRRRGGALRDARRPRQHDRHGLAGHHDRLRPVPQPQVRPVLAEGLLPDARLLRQRRVPVVRRRARRSMDTWIVEPELELPTPRAGGAARRRCRREARLAAARARRAATSTADAAQAWEREIAGRRPAVWTALEPTCGSSAQSGAALARLPDGSLLASGAGARPKDTYTVDGPRCRRPRITAFRLEALPDPSLPAEGPGRDDYGQLRADRPRGQRSTAPAASRSPHARVADVNEKRRRRLRGPRPTTTATGAGAGHRRRVATTSACASRRALRRGPAGRRATLTLTLAFRSGWHAVQRASAASACPPRPRRQPLRRPRPCPTRSGGSSPRPSPQRSGQSSGRRSSRGSGPSRRRSTRPRDRAAARSRPSSTQMKVLDRARSCRSARPTSGRPRSCASAAASSQGREGLRGGARRVLPPLPDDADAEPARPRALAREPGQPAHRARDREPRLGAVLRPRPRRDRARTSAPRASARSHPELLDWLADRVRASAGGAMKALHRLIVTSATYRQSSRVTPALLERDPDNRLLARGPAVPPRGRDGPRRGARRERAAQPEDRRPERLPAAARGHLGRPVQRRTKWDDEHGRGPLPPRPLHVLRRTVALSEPRRPSTRRAASSARCAASRTNTPLQALDHPQRPGLRRGGARAWPRRMVRGGAGRSPAARADLRVPPVHGPRARRRPSCAALVALLRRSSASRFAAGRRSRPRRLHGAAARTPDGRRRRAGGAGRSWRTSC